MAKDVTGVRNDVTTVKHDVSEVILHHIYIYIYMYMYIHIYYRCVCLYTYMCIYGHSLEMLTLARRARVDN